MGNTQKLNHRTWLRALAGAAAVVVLSGVAVVTTSPADTAQANSLNSAAGIGYYQPSDSSFHLSYEVPPSGGGSDRAFQFGPNNSGGIVPVWGDWDGNGSSSVGWYRYSDASWHLTEDLNDGTDITFLYGPAGNTSVVPVAGDWNGDGKDTVGWYRPSDASWHLASTNGNGATSSTFVFGEAGNSSVTAIAGDWNGDGKDTVGWYRPSDGSWHLASANANGATSTPFAWGEAGNPSVQPLAGDWNGDGKDTVGWYRASDASYHLTDTNATGSASINFVFGPKGNSSLVPVAGDWDGKVAPSSSAQDVARRLVQQKNDGKLFFDKAGIYEREILPLAQTGSVASDCRVDIRILQMLAMTADRFGDVMVSDMNRPCIDSGINCSQGSYHCAIPSKALDVWRVGGKSVVGTGTATHDYLNYIDSIAPVGIQAGQSLCPNPKANIQRGWTFTNIGRQFDDGCTHQHIDLGTAAGAVRYTP